MVVGSSMSSDYCPVSCCVFPALRITPRDGIERTSDTGICRSRLSDEGHGEQHSDPSDRSFTDHPQIIPSS